MTMTMPKPVPGVVVHDSGMARLTKNGEEDAWLKMDGGYRVYGHPQVTILAAAYADALTKIESLSRRVSAAEQERDAALDRARMQTNIAKRATDELAESKYTERGWWRHVRDLTREIDAWRGRFPGYRYRPQDDCIELEQKT